MDSQRLFSVIDELNDTYCDIWEKICNIESPTGYKKGVDEVGNVFIEMANERKWLVEIFEHNTAGNAICITINPKSKEKPVVFSGHIDTVHPVGLFGTPAVHRDENRIYGPGVTDCKGGVVASFMALDALEKCGFTARPVKLIIQTDEETGSKTSDMQTVSFMVNAAKNAIAFLNTEGIDGNTAILTRKGILRYRFVVQGKAAHSAICTSGANAVCEAAHKIIKLETMKDTAGLTCNCGVIHGGTVANTVAEQCEFLADIRFADKSQYDEAVRICENIAKENTVSGCDCRLEKVSERPVMPSAEENFVLLEKMNEIYKRCGLPTLTACAGLGGSDAAHTTNAGIPTIDSIGVAGGYVHSIKEYAYLDSLAACAKRLSAVACYI